MRFFDWLVVVVMGVVGWLVVSFLLNRSKPPENDAADEASMPRDGRPSPAADAEFTEMPPLPSAVPVPPVALNVGGHSSLLSLEEMGRAWSSILGVPTDASGAQIESAYHAKLAEYDRVRFDPNAGAAHREQAERQRARVNQAYEFIRPSRS